MTPLLWFCLGLLHLVTADIDPDCLEAKIQQLVDKSEQVFDDLEQIWQIGDARIESVDPTTRDVALTVLWYHLNPSTGAYDTYQQMIKVNESNAVIEEGEMESLGQDPILFVDWTQDQYASISIDQDGDQVLTVKTNNSATSCSLKLSFHVSHGVVMTNLVFGSFRFSPNGGKYILYQAEAPRHSNQNLFHESFEETQDIREPAIYLYDVAKVSFQRLRVPKRYSPGQLQWHPDGKHIVGVAWSREEPGLLYPWMTNIANRLFIINVETKKFQFLSGENFHFFAPRFDPNGTALVYFENCLHGLGEHKAYPGPYTMSSRLMMINWTDVLGHLNNGTLATDSKQTLINNSQMGAQQPETLPGGRKFYGFYPPVSSSKIPERSFSADGKTVYLTTYDVGTMRLLAVDLTTKQVTLRGAGVNPEIRLVDTLDDVLLVQRGDVKRSPHLAIGRVDHTTTVSTIDPTLSTTSSTLDPCLHLLQELELEGIDRNVTVFDLSGGNQGSDQQLGYQGGGIAEVIPLPLARVKFNHVTHPREFSHEVDYYELKDESKPNATLNSTHFNAWIALPESKSKDIDLVVYIKGGPHSIKTQEYDADAQRFLAMGFAYMTVNYRGSIGYGDASVQALIGNIGKMAVSDTHQAIRQVINWTPKLSGNVVLLGNSYGGFIATHLASNFPSMYPVVILQNPLVRGGGGSFFLDWFMETEHGRNVSSLFVPNEDSYFDALESSSLKNIDNINASVLVFVGLKDRTTPAEAQGLYLHKVLQARNKTTEAYTFPEEGHSISGSQNVKDKFVTIMKWIHEHLGIHAKQCPTVAPTTSTSESWTDSPVSPTKGPPVSGASVSASQKAFAYMSLLSFTFILLSL